MTHNGILLTTFFKGGEYMFAESLWHCTLFLSETYYAKRIISGKMFILYVVARQEGDSFIFIFVFSKFT